jgi:ABC-type nitrate/sulfonate/bicarbonate transport system substrate-binding protein
MSTAFDRRTFLKVSGSTLAAATALAACGTSAGQDSGAGTGTIRTQLFWTHSVDYAGWYLADARGHFAAQGVTSTLLPGGPNLTSTQAVVLGGQADVGMSTLQGLAQAVGQGASLVGFAAQFQQSPGGLLSLAGKPIRVPADILGKTLALDVSAKSIVDAILTAAGLPKDYKTITSTGDVQQLTGGAADAIAALVTSQKVTLDQRGVANAAVTFSELGYPAYGNILFTTREILDRRGDQLAGYLRALRQGWQDDIARPDAGAELAVQKYGSDNGLDLAQQKLENNAQIPLLQSEVTRTSGLLAMSMDEIVDVQYRAMHNAGVKDLAPADKVVTLDVITKAKNS